MGFYAAEGTSSEDVSSPTSKSVPEPPGTSTTESPGQATGSPEESSTKAEKPHDTSSCVSARCKLVDRKNAWPPYYSYKKTNGNDEWRLTEWLFAGIGDTHQNSFR